MIRLCAMLALAIAAPTSHAQAVGTAVTYQGELRAAGAPASAPHDFEFRLFNAASGGAQVGPTVIANGVPVSNGLFAVPLDFGPGQFAGDAQWLEIAVRATGGGNHETLLPRTAITAAPYALGAVAALADSVSSTSVIDGSVVAADIDATQVQLRVGGSCATGQFLRSVNQDGSVSCEADASGAGTVTSIASGTGLTGGPITGAGTLSVAAGGIGAIQIDDTQVQRRVGGSCATGQFLRAVNQDGSVSCEADASGTGTVTSIASGTGLTGGPITGAGTLSVAAGGIGAVQINDAQVQRRVGGSCPAGQFMQTVAQDGTVTCASGVAAWTLAGNAGTDPLANFLGTTDNRALVLRANNQRVGQYAAVTLGGPAGGFSANVLLGSPENSITTGVRGATISGGGNRTGDSEIGLSEENPNRVTDHYGTVGGGYANQAGDAAGTTSDKTVATVAGGKNNVASGVGSAIGGGSNNVASEFHGTVAGGTNNNASGFNSTIGGGQVNLATGTYGVIAGGSSNEANLEGSAVGGGRDNVTGGIYSTIVGGLNNATGGNGSTVGGGINNCAGGWYSFAAGWRAKVRPGTDPGGTGPCSGLTYPGGSGDIGTFVWAGFAGTDFVSTGVEQFLVRAEGGIGFNTNAPITAFDVVSDTENAHTASIRNLSDDSPSGLQIRLGVVTPTAINNFLTFERADGTNVGAVEGNGTGGVVFRTSGGDYAEYLPKADARADLPAGSVVGIRNGAVSLDTHQADQLAVVSSSPAVIGNDPGDARQADHALIAFIGQADVRVLGTVAAGDYLVTSERNDGVAHGVPPQALGADLLSRVVGRAWQAKAGDTDGMVRALVGLDPVAIAQARQIALQARAIDELTADQAALREELRALRRRIEAQDR
jgi:hypothetical protein